jgi:catechol 2,3-dioxygenase-like lactoylglutathione lyase family enzyme
MQITDAPIQTMVAVADLDRARRWYADKLGWKPASEDDTIYEVGGSSFELYRSEFAGTAKNTVMNWTVDDVAATVEELRGRGVTFEEYDFGDVKTVDGIMTDSEGGKTAWFKDSDGNIVGVISAPEGAPPGVANASVTPMVAASDLERAKDWYAAKLGFNPVFEYPGVVLTYPSGDTSFTVYATQFAGTAQNTVATWRLTGLRAEVERLKGRGVAFEEYDFGDGGRTVDGILSDGEGGLLAWFKDSEGNILGLAEDRGGPSE